jgi:hypothetical protein
MDSGSLDPQLGPANWDGDSSEPSSSDIDSPPCKHARLRGVASHVRQGQKVHPYSAYVGTPAHDIAITAKSEFEVLSSFIVPYCRDGD